MSDPALTVPPNFVLFQVGERLTFPEVSQFGPFDVNAIPDEQFAPVEPGAEFYIDVIGCSDGAVDACDQGSEFTARGCTEYMVLQRDEIATIRIVVELPTAGDTHCPPT